MSDVVKPNAVNLNFVNLTFNGKKVTVPKGTLLVEAAKQVGIDIPVFCYHEKLKPVGACRMCLVEIEKMPRLQTACTTPVAEGMVVNSASPAAVAGQQGVIEMLLANHPLDCPICDKGGECPLQDNTFRYGQGTSRMTEEKRAKDKAFPLSESIVLDKERCILCYRCTRFQAEIAGDSAIVPLERGGWSEIGTQDGESFDSPFAGNTIELCPVGALTSRFYRFRARPWDLKRTPSVCAGCSLGCNLSVHARDGAVLRVMARENKAIDDGWLCDRGRFHTLPPVTAPGQLAQKDSTPKRPLVPMLRQDGKLQPAKLADALARTVQLLATQGGVQCSPLLTNEALQALDQKLRPALPGLRLGFDAPVTTPWPVQGAVANLPKCRKVVLLGLDPWTEIPVLALWLRKAATAGGAVVTVGPDNGLFRDTAAWLKVAREEVAATAGALLAALDGRSSTPLATAAAGNLKQDGPAAVLLHPALAADAALLATAKALAQKLSADAATGLLGAPALQANARGAQELATAFAQSLATAGLQALLLLAPERLPPQSATRLVVATSHEVEDRADIDVVLPLAHPYETQGTWTNLLGLRQPLAVGGFAGRGVVQDHALITQLAALAAPATATATAAQGGRK